MGSTRIAFKVVNNDRLEVKLFEAAGGQVSAALSDRLVELDATLARTSICGLGQVALGPLRSILENFPNERAGD